MRKTICVTIAILLALSSLPAFAESAILYPKDADFTQGVSKSDAATGFMKGSYIGFSEVDLTGKRSVSIKATAKLVGGANGEAIRVMLDNPVSGIQIGTIVVCEEKDEYSAYIEGTEGIHDVYFVGSDPKDYGTKTQLSVTSFEFKDTEYDDKAFEKQVSDSFIKDVYSDTWQATDSMGRHVADYSETGAPKADREVGMMYWNWFSKEGTSTAKVIPEIMAEYPDALISTSHVAWSGMNDYFWNEPALGFYSSYDYFVYRRHMEMLAAVGVDAIFLDYSNSGATYTKPLMVLAQAMRDAKKDGVDIPRLSCFLGSDGDSVKSARVLSSLYQVCFCAEDMSDIWYFLDGKPLLFGYPSANVAAKSCAPGDNEEKRLFDQINSFFTFRATVYAEKDKEGWVWVENFPQEQRGGIKEDGRCEFMAVGVAINESYVLGQGVAYVMSDKYAKGRGYSNVFGEDYGADGPKKAYYFREQSNLALSEDPHFIYVDGWNELTAGLQNQYQGFPAAFVDAFDSENSRDFEPVKGLLKDDYYMLLADFIRKYKGVRPAPSAGPEKTIDISKDGTQWDSVTPTYYNYPAENRNFESGYLDRVTGKRLTYQTNSANRITESKVSRDAQNLYFTAKTKENALTLDTSLYINTDRNPATGFFGYDYVIGRDGGNVIERISSDGAYTQENEAKLIRNGNTITLAINRNYLGLGGALDFEFKWVEGSFSDIIDLYEKCSSAPIGRFNYLYTEGNQVALTAKEKAIAKYVSVLVAGKNKMIANGGIQTVYGTDISITPFEMNGTLYVPADTFEELLAGGRSKVRYDGTANILRFYDYTMSEDGTEVLEKNWYYTVLGSLEAHKNGRLATLSAPVIANNGIVYVPLSIFAEMTGVNVQNLGNGIFAVGNEEAAVLNSLSEYIK